jgi:hypothetical protein
VLLAVNGNVYDVRLEKATNSLIFYGIRYWTQHIFLSSPKRSFYGPGGPYHLFAGRDASRALAKSSLLQEDVENTSTKDLTPSERSTLQDWETNYRSLYDLVGRIVDSSSQKTNPGEESKPREEPKKQESWSSSQRYFHHFLNQFLHWFFSFYSFPLHI